MLQFFRYYLDRMYLKRCHELCFVKSITDNKGYWLITFNKKIIELMDSTYLYSMSLKEFYDNFRIFKRRIA